MADKAPKKRPLNLDQLAKLSLPDLSGVKGAVTRATEAMRPLQVSSAIEEAMKPMREAGAAGAAMREALMPTREMDSMNAALKAAMGVTDPLQGAMAEAMKPFRDIEDRMRSITAMTGQHNALGKVAEQIAGQQRAIDSLMNRPAVKDSLEREITVPRLPKLPPNPLIETNKRLGRIEDRFEQIQQIAGEAASIANGLQGAAAEFLAEFKLAAQENSRAARTAIWLGATAVIATLIVAMGQIAYNEFWRVPADSQAMSEAIVEMKSEITALREQNATTIERLEQALESSDADLAATIRALVDRLPADPPPTP